jgi:hypothetical protein
MSSLVEKAALKQKEQGGNFTGVLYPGITCLLVVWPLALIFSLI